MTAQNFYHTLQFMLKWTNKEIQNAGFNEDWVQHQLDILYPLYENYSFILDEISLISTVNITW